MNNEGFLAENVICVQISTPDSRELDNLIKDALSKNKGRRLLTPHPTTLATYESASKKGVIYTQILWFVEEE